MNQNNSNDIIEISDDSDDYSSGNAGRGRYQGTKRSHPSDSSSSSDVSSSSSDEVEWVKDSDQEPEVECELWDDDCVILKIVLTSKAINGFHLMPTCSPDPEINLKQKKTQARLNDQYEDDEFFVSLKNSFSNDNAFTGKSCEIISDPWKVLVLDALLDEPSVLDSARQEMYELPWNMRQMDLYEYFQSQDLKYVNSENLSVIYNFVKTELKSWVEKLTDLEFVDVSVTCSFYGDTDFLLVHDDQRENRAIAFVLYLTGDEGWNVDWGGALQLYDRDGNNQPVKAARNIVPKNNQLVLFPVSDHSYHMVEEIKCKNYCRLSINGWFHTKEPLKFDAPIYKPPSVGIYSDKYFLSMENDVELKDWVDSAYLSQHCVSSIQSYIEENSEMSLEMFFCETKLSEVANVIGNKEIKWEQMGPPNRRSYEYLSTAENIPAPLNDFIELFQTRKFFDRINQFTGLEVTRMKWELQKWTTGCYSLLDEHPANQLDVIVFFGDVNVVGGKTHYVTLEDEVQSALITIPPMENTLNLIYGDTARYTSFVSRYNDSKTFYIFMASYFEDAA